jgi:hypothetical protein
MKRLMTLLCALVLCASSLQAALPAPSSSGQLVGIKVTGGYHLGGLFIVLNGQLEFVGNAAAGKTTMWVNNFSTAANLNGEFSLMFPIASLPLPKDPKGTVVKIVAHQDKTNVVATKDFDLSELNNLIHGHLTVDMIRHLVEATR